MGRGVDFKVDFCRYIPRCNTPKIQRTTQKYSNVRLYRSTVELLNLSTIFLGIKKILTRDFGRK